MSQNEAGAGKAVSVTRRSLGTSRLDSSSPQLCASSRLTIKQSNSRLCCRAHDGSATAMRRSGRVRGKAKSTLCGCLATVAMDEAAWARPGRRQLCGGQAAFGKPGRRNAAIRRRLARLRRHVRAPRTAATVRRPVRVRQAGSPQCGDSAASAWVGRRVYAQDETAAPRPCGGLVACLANRVDAPRRFGGG